MSEEKVLSFLGKDAKELPEKYRGFGWLLPGTGLWLSSASHFAFDRDAIYLISKWQLDKMIYFLSGTEYDVGQPSNSYRCNIKGQIYFAMGWEGNFGRFGLEEAYWIMRDYNNLWEFVQLKHLQDYDFAKHHELKYPEHFAIESQGDDRHSYYLVSELEDINPKCPICKRPVWKGNEIDPIECWVGGLWYRWGDRYGLQRKQLEKIQESAPELWREYDYCLVCSPYCQYEMEQQASRAIKERIEPWVRNRKEQDRIKRLRKMSQVARKALKTRNRDVLQSLQKEYEREAISLP